MYPKTIAIDLAKNVFEIAIGDGAGRVLARHRLNRDELSQFLIWKRAAAPSCHRCR